ncbi:MAG: class I SAM-dependent methyltransferase [bacterium]|nr:class I SAM-dependent methyltransferase [bacterium]
MPYNTIIIDAPGVIKKAGVKPGDIIADLGTGREGRMALSAGRIVGEHGIAYAVDVVKSILPTIATKAKVHGINNVQTVWSNLEIYGATRAITDNALDVAFLVTTLFQSKQRMKIMQETYRMMKPGARLAVVDWKPGVSAPFGPEEAVRVHPEEIKGYATELSMQLIEEFDAGQYHWGLIFVK